MSRLRRGAGVHLVAALLLLCPIFLSPRAARADDLRCGSFPTLYGKKDLRKRAVVLRQHSPDLGSVRFNSKASSVMVPEGWIVTLYQYKNYGGARLVLNGSRGGKRGCIIENLVRPSVRDHRDGNAVPRSWDNKASSAKVRRNSGESGTEP